jgi:hypothetical protein
MSNLLEACTVRKGWSFGGYQSPCAPGAIIKVLCSDGKTRHATVIAYADTYSSLPCKVKVKGKTVTGHLYTVKEWTEKPEIHFSPYGDLKNHHLLPDWSRDKEQAK